MLEKLTKEHKKKIKKESKDFCLKIINILHDFVEKQDLKIMTYDVIIEILFKDNPKQQEKFRTKKPINFKLEQLVEIEKILNIQLLNISIDER